MRNYSRNVTICLKTCPKSFLGPVAGKYRVSIHAIVIVAVIFLLVLLIGIVIGWRLGAVSKPPPTPPGPPPPPHKIPDTFDEVALSSALAVRLAGTPANGARMPANQSYASVIWVDGGDEVLVHLNSATVRIMDRM